MNEFGKIIKFIDKIVKMGTTVHGLPGDIQKKHRILVCTLAAYGGRIVPAGFEWLKQSCDKFGIQLTIFGEGEMFTNMYDSKLEYLGYCIWNLRTQYDHVICIDSADTLFLRPLSEDDMAFISEDICFMAERNEFPLEQLREPLTEKTKNWGTTYRFLNAGGFMGNMTSVVKTFAYMRYKRSILQDVPEMTCGTCTTFNDDQAAWNYEFLQGYVTIDAYCWIFQTLWGVTEWDVTPAEFSEPLAIDPYMVRLLNKEHQTFPLVLHANGSAAYENYYTKIVNN